MIILKYFYFKLAIFMHYNLLKQQSKKNNEGETKMVV